MGGFRLLTEMTQIDTTTSLRAYIRINQWASTFAYCQQLHFYEACCLYFIVIILIYLAFKNIVNAIFSYKLQITRHI